MLIPAPIFIISNMLYLTKIKEVVLDILFPPVCPNCKNSLREQEKDGSFCGHCLSKIFIHNTLFCPICRARLPNNKKICHKKSSYLLGAATNYDEPVKALIRQFKYGYWTRLAKPLGNILATYLENLALNIRTSEVQNIDDNFGTSDVQILKKKLFKNYIVIPIPLHKNRLREREFNQAEILAKIIAGKLNLVMRAGALIRVKETKSQADLKDWEDRKSNLAGSFAAGAPKIVSKKNIILVDDVFTSGATINEAVKTLRLAGARKIIALVVAKTR